MEKRRSPAFRFYAKDFMVSTLHMDLRVRGAYITLLCYQWENDVIPHDHSKLARILGIEKKEFDEIWLELKDKFPDNRNPRLEITRKEQKAFTLESSKAGKKGGGNPNFHKGRPNPYKGKDKGGDKGSHKGKDKAKDKLAFASAFASASSLSPANAIADKDIPAKAGTPQAEFVKNWADLYFSKTGQVFKADTKDYVLVAKLLKDFSAPVVLDKAKLLFELCNNGGHYFAKSMADFTIGNLSTNWNKIIQEVKNNGKQAGVSRSELADFMSGRE